MKKPPRLNDTVAIVAEPVNQIQRNESRSTRVEKISNGFLVHKTSNDGERYECSTEFSPTQPDLDSAKPEDSTSLRKAVSYMKQKAGCL